MENLKTNPNWLSPEVFCLVVRNTPLVSIDLIIRNVEGAVLVGLRTFEPAKGYWFVPGGRIEKSETLDAAFERILRGETGLVMARKSASFLGAYEHFYETNRMQEPGYGTHYVVLAYEVALAGQPQIKLDDQHEGVRWMTPEAILSDTGVHPNTQAYFAKLPC